MWCSELYEPGNRLRGQAASLPVVHGQPPPNVEMSAQQRKDSWRGRPASANLPQGQVLPDTEGSAPQRKDSWRGRSAAQPPGVLGHAHLLQLHCAVRNSDDLCHIQSACLVMSLSGLASRRALLQGCTYITMAVF